MFRGAFRTAALSLAILALPSALWADEEPMAPADIGPKAILKAIEENGEVFFAEAAADLEIARSRVDSARAGLMPRLTLTASGEAYETSHRAYRADDDREVTGKLEVVQPIYDFGQTYSKIQSGREHVMAAEQRFAAARNAVLMEGLANYFGLHASELTLRALLEAHASAYVSWEKAKEREPLGQTSPIDVAEKLADVEKTRLEMFAERSVNGDLRSRLTELTGYLYGEELRDAPEAPQSTPDDIDIDGVAKAAIAKNKEVNVLAHQLAAKTRERTGTGALPTLDAFGNVQHHSRDMRGRDEWAVGARLTWPIFDGGLKNAEKGRLAGEEGKLAAQLETMKRRVKRQVRQVVLARVNAYQRVVAARANLDYSGRKLMQRQRLYEQERVTRLGFAMIENTEAEADLVRANGTYFLEGAKLAVLLGGTPADTFDPGFLNRLSGTVVEEKIEQFVPKEGSGFGQDDQDKINRKRPE